jgi:prephenate dehydratase
VKDIDVYSPVAVTGRDRHATRVAVCGARGSFADSASRQLVQTPIELVQCANFEAALTAVQSGHADVSVLPRENTLVGSITPALDAVLDRSMRMVGETVLRIEHHLIGFPGAQLSEIQRVHSHPAALGQCRTFLRGHPQWQQRQESDTATAVQVVLWSGDRTAAAIASRDAAALYGGHIICSNLEDSAQNFTRFVLLADGHTPWPEGADTMSLEVQTRHEAGALLRLLELFAERQLSVLTLETRPDRELPWHLRFIVEVFSGPAAVDWDSIEADVRERVERLRVLGRYRAAAERLPYGPRTLTVSTPDWRRPAPADHHAN